MNRAKGPKVIQKRRKKVVRRLQKQEVYHDYYARMPRVRKGARDDDGL